MQWPINVIWHGLILQIIYTINITYLLITMKYWHRLGILLPVFDKSKHTLVFWYEYTLTCILIHVSLFQNNMKKIKLDKKQRWMHFNISASKIRTFEILLWIVVWWERNFKHVDWGRRPISSLLMPISEWLLFNTNSSIFQLYHGESKLIVNEMMMRSALY
jgi:hypothetical protein